jgi:hypothetical protein
MNAIQVVQNRYQVAGQALLQNPVQGGVNTIPFVRRPTRGLQIKEDTFATIRLVAGTNGQNLSLVDAGSRRTDSNAQPIQIGGMRATDIYSNFLLQKVHEERMEKIQVLETFGEPYIFLFGERPRIITFQGILVNTFDFNWEAEWWYNYDNYLRGTKAVENDARAFITYDTTLVSGYIISASADKVSGEPYFLNFQFQLFLTDYTNFSNIGNPYAEPGLSVAATNNGTNQTSTQLITSAAAAAQFTPTVIGPGGPTDDDIDDFNSSVSLAQGFESQIAAVTSAWTSAADVVNSTLSGVAGAILGSGVVVPYGFAGALEFDDSEATSLLVQPQYGVAVTFGTYDQNDDEYVGVGSQYGSSVTPNGVFPVNLPSFGPNADLSADEAMVETATAQWAAAGFDVSSEGLGSVSGVLIGGELGLQAVNNSSLASSSPDPGTADPPFGAGLTTGSLPS